MSILPHRPSPSRCLPRPVCCPSRHDSNSPWTPSPANRSPPWPISTRSAASSSTSNSHHAHDALDQAFDSTARPTRPNSSSGCPSPSPGCGNWSSASPSSATAPSAASTNCSTTSSTIPCRWDRSTTSCTRPSRTHARSQRPARPRRRSHRRPRRDLPGWPARARRRRCRFDLLLSAQRRGASRRRHLGRAAAGADATAASIPTPPSPISPGDCGPAKPRPCPTCPVAATSSTPCRPRRRWSATWRIAPTTPSPPAAVSKSARPAASTARAVRMQSLAAQLRYAREAETPAVDAGRRGGRPCSAGCVRTSWPCAAPTTPAAAPCTTGSWPNCGRAKPHCPHRIRPVRCLLENQRDDLLAFAQQLDQDLQALAEDIRRPRGGGRRSPPGAVAWRANRPERWQREQALWQRWGSRYGVLRAAVTALLGQVVRASSVIENLNSRLRSYFFLRRHLGGDYLALLQFFLNHRRFVRSEHPERVGKSPGGIAHGSVAPARAGVAGLHAVLQELVPARTLASRSEPTGPLRVRTVT